MAATSPFDDVQFPTFSTLPFRPGDPEGAIWGFYEHISRSDAKDQLGSINLLTPSRILRASQTEIKHGRVCSLNWELHKPFPAGYKRKGLEHIVFRMPEIKGGYVMDDEISMNTQCGSQWDGLQHWSYYKTGQFYNGLHISEVLDLGDGITGKRCAYDEVGRNGIHVLQGKIVGRGVLLDFLSYAQKNGINYTPNKHHAVTAHDLEMCAQSQGVKFEQGDILFVRMGFVQWYDNAATDDEKKAVHEPPTRAVGIRQSMEEVEWMWDHHFAAVASDTPAFEARPNNLEWNLHDYFLALWGTPMGELFDLEELSQICKELDRYSFFVTSSPLNIVNGIASPPNVMAIF